MVMPLIKPWKSEMSNEHERIHRPVMLQEVLSYLAPQPNQNFVDGTLGLGGHSQRILEATHPNGHIVGIDRDQSALKFAKENLSEFKERVHFIHDDFRNLDKVLEDLKIRDVHGILLDLGVSSLQLDSPQRGFSFRNEGPLDMRMDQFSHISAYDLINSLSEKEIASIIKNFGEERYSHRIARYVIQERNKKPIETTSELVEIIQRAMPFHNRHEKIHPATRTFQALRIAVNRELESLQIALEKCFHYLKPEGRLAVISFHSLEDRIVKNVFRNLSKEQKVQLLTKKPLRPSEDEMRVNPRARSARLRIIERQT